MVYRTRRWAAAALLFGANLAFGSDDEGIILPPAPDVTTLPASVIAPFKPVHKEEVQPANVESPPVAPPKLPDLPPTPAIKMPYPAASSSVPAPDPPDCLVTRTPPDYGCWYGGAGLLFLRPYLSNNTAYTVITPPVPPALGVFPVANGSAVNQSFQWPCRQTYQVWGGWTHSSGWGVRANYFEFSEVSDPASITIFPDPIAPRLVTVPAVIPFIPGAAAFGAPSAILAGAGIGADQLQFVSTLTLRAMDIEGTYQLSGGDFLLRLSAGARCQTIKQGYHASLVNAGDGTTFETQQLDATQEFQGAGPILGFFGRHGICYGLAGFASARASILVGSLEQRATFAQDISDPTMVALVGSQQTRTQFENRADHVVTFGELEFGLEWGYNLGRTRLYTRGSFIAQAYGNAGNATTSLGTIGLIGGQAAIGIDY